jgi:hypothetical protein
MLIGGGAGGSQSSLVFQSGGRRVHAVVDVTQTKRQSEVGMDGWMGGFESVSILATLLPSVRRLLARRARNLSGGL